MNEHLAELGVDVWVGWRELPGAATTDLNDFIQDTESLDSAEPTSFLTVSRPASRQTSNKTLKGQVFSNSELPISPAASIAAASGLVVESDKREVSDDAAMNQARGQTDVNNSISLDRGFSGNFIFLFSENYVVVADGVASHLYIQTISLLRSIINVMPDFDFDDNRILQFSWPPFIASALPGQDDQSAARTLLDMFGNVEGNKKKMYIYFGDYLSSYLMLHKNIPENKRLSFGESELSNWLLLPSLQRMLESAEEKRNAWRLIRTEIFDRNNLEK